MSGEASESEADRVPNEPPTPGQDSNACAHVFISYASQDVGVSDGLVEALERQGVACWIAPRDVTAGALYADAIVRAISGAKALVLVLSANSVASAHVGKEIERASSKHRPIIALRIDAAPLSPALEYFLGESQWVDVRAAGMDVALSKLIAAIRDRSADAPLHTLPLTVGMSTFKARAVTPVSRRSWMLLMIACAGVVLALASLLADRFRFSKHSALNKPAASTLSTAPTRVPNLPANSEKSVAVLPFVDMSEKKDQEYFADGMAEEVIDLLAKVPGIKVIGRTSSFQFKGKSEDLRTIGSALGVTYMVEGSVRKAGDRLRVTAQLVSTRDGSHLWAESYDASSGDVLNIQDRIAAGLARALQVTVGADDLRAPAMLKSTEAYDLYLRGRHALDRWDRMGFESAAQYFQQALDLDPTAERAAEWLAFAQSNLALWSFVAPREGFERARSSAERALRLNPRSGEAHSILASTSAVYDWDWPTTERESAQALALEPRNPFVIGNVGFARSAYAQPADSARAMSSALALDPLNATWHELLGQMRYRAGRLAEAEVELHKTLDLSPTYAEGYFFLGQILLAEGKPETALVVMQQETPENGRDTGLAIAYYALGRKAESDAALARLTKSHAGDAAYEIAQAHAFRAELDDAFMWLNRAYNQKDVELYWFKGDPLLLNLAGDPRYKAFLRKMNLPE